MIYGARLIVLALLSVRCDAGWVGLFTPDKPHVGRYEICTGGDNYRESQFSYTEPEYLEPLDAFGNAGSYDRAKLARLYGGRRVTVVRGWRRDGDRFESVPRLSP